MNKQMQNDEFFKRIVKSGGYETPSDGFSERLMLEISRIGNPYQSAHYASRPIISKKAWIVIAICSVIFIGLVLSSPIALTSQPPEKIKSFWEMANSWVDMVKSPIANSIAIIGIIISCLFMLDTVVLSKKFGHNSKR